MVINPIGAPNVDRNDATNTHPLVIDIKKLKSYKKSQEQLHIYQYIWLFVLIHVFL